jgi:phosphoserine phosphatase
VGDNLNDIGMLAEADRAFVIAPKSPRVARETDARELGAFRELLRELDAAPAGLPPLHSPAH